MEVHDHFTYGNNGHEITTAAAAAAANAGLTRLNAGKLTIPQLYYCPCYKCSCFLCIPTGVSLGVILAYVLVNFLIECDLNYCLDITSCDIGLFSAEVAGITMHLTFGCASISFTVDTILVIVRVVFKRTVIRVLIT